MGNEAAAKSRYNQCLNIQSPYKINHQILQNSVISSSKNIMKTHISGCKEKDIQKWVKTVERIHEMDRQYLLVAKSIKLKQLALFGSDCSLTLVFDCYPYLLMDQVRNRRNISATFEEEEIWYLVWALVDASKLLLEHHLKLGDIRPHNIVFNQSGDVKFICELSWPNQLSNYIKTRYLKSITFLSPQQLHLMTTGEQNDYSRQEMSESFSIGLTLLSLMRVQDMSNLYEADQMYYGINVKKLNNYLLQLEKLSYWDADFKNKKMYSEGLKFVVRKMCEKNIENRLSISQLWHWLKPYKQNIINFKPFDLQKHLNNMLKQQSPRKPIFSPSKQQSPNLQRRQENIEMLNRQPPVTRFTYNQNSSGEKPKNSIIVNRPQSLKLNQSPLGKWQNFDMSRVTPYNSLAHQSTFPHPLQFPPQNIRNPQPIINPSAINMKPPQAPIQVHLNRVANQNSLSPNFTKNQDQIPANLTKNPVPYAPLQPMIYQNPNHQINFVPYPIFNSSQHMPIINMAHKVVSNLTIPPEYKQSQNQNPDFQQNKNEQRIPNKTNVQNRNHLPFSQPISKIYEQGAKPKIQTQNERSIEKIPPQNQNNAIQYRPQTTESVYIKEAGVRKFADEAEKLISKIDIQLNKSKNLFPNQ